MRQLWAFGILALSLLLVYPNVGKTEMTIKAYQASYQLYWNGLAVGHSQHVVKELAANRYWAEAHSFPILSFLPFEDLEQGEFLQQNNDYMPINFTFLSRSNKKRLEGILTFDWRHLKVMKKLKEKSEIQNVQEAIPLHAKDKISFFFQLRAALRAGKKEFQYTIIEPKKVSLWRMVVIGEEKIHTPIGTFNTLKLENRIEANDRITHFWVAKELDYILVKLDHYHKGKKRAEAKIKEFSSPNSPRQTAG